MQQCLADYHVTVGYCAMHHFYFVVFCNLLLIVRPMLHREIGTNVEGLHKKNKIRRFLDLKKKSKSVNDIKTVLATLFPFTTDYKVCTRSRYIWSKITAVTYDQVSE